MDCKSFLAYVRNSKARGMRCGTHAHEPNAPWHNTPDVARRAAHTAYRAGSRHGANSPSSLSQAYASLSSINTVWNKKATTQATVTCRAKTAAAERPPNSERTVPIAATHGG